MTNFSDSLNRIYRPIRRILFLLPASAVTGTIVAFFLWALDAVTRIRWEKEWLLFFLPVAGVTITFLYQWAGKQVEQGNNLIMDEIHEPGGGVPTRMAPLVLLGTIITHLFGGSAGREGTAVQMGGSIAGLFSKWFKLKKDELGILLMTGVAAGFGAVFGTPLTGAIFAIEVLTIGRFRYDALVYCLLAAFTGHWVCNAWGASHTQYFIRLEDTSAILQLNFPLVMKVLLAGIVFGLTAYAFSKLTHGLKEQFSKYIKFSYLIPVIGGLLIIGLTYILGTSEYLGLGVSGKKEHSVSIVNAFSDGGAQPLSWFWKIVFTAITLGSGFKGGEVTPLFFIGATLGNLLSLLFGTPVDLMAGLGFIAVFAGATNTPLACTIMGLELFGPTYTVYYALACFTAYFFSGNSGIYSSQKNGSNRLARIKSIFGKIIK